MTAIHSVLVTGANRGLGLQFVKEFLKLSHPPNHIIAVCREPDKATELKQLSTSHPSVHLLKLEITEPSQYDAAVAAVRKIVGKSGLSMLINNAGIFDWNISTLEAHTKENMMQHLDINLVTPVLISKAFLPLLKEAAAAGKAGEISASIVNVSAILGIIKWESHFPGGFPYKYSKAAFNMATHCLAGDLQPSGIFVMALHPGWVKTDMGGPNGMLTPEESVGGCMKVITSINDSYRGNLVNWKGEILEN